MTHYAKLGKDSFRLLSFEDETGMALSLSNHLLEGAPRYIALSYTWGMSSSKVTYSIKIDGKNFIAQPNLYEALKHLAPQVKRSNCLFWVDAICINQNDTDERNAQVKKMKEIYENADYIFAWLGLPKDEEQSGLAIGLMRTFNLYLHNAQKENNGEIGIALAALRSNPVAFPVEDDSETWKGWLALRDIFTHPYWTRTWIYQEATTPGQIYFWYGDRSFDDIYLSAAVSFGMTYAKMLNFSSQLLGAFSTATSLSQLTSGRIQREKGRKKRFIAMLEEMRLTRCTDARDKVYAPLGHAVDVDPDRFPVNYDKSLVDVYIDAARFSLFRLENASLEIFGQVFTPADESKNYVLSEQYHPPMPSWVPDWRCPVILSHFYVSSTQINEITWLYDPYPGSDIHVHITGRELRVKGTVVSHLRVKTLTSIWDDIEAATLEIPRSWYNSLISGRATDTVPGREEAIRRSLVGNRSRAVFSSKTGGHISGGSIDWSLVDRREDQLDWETHEKRTDMISDATATCYGRRIGVLSDGRIAVLPAAAREDDQVALFFGGKCLYLLRSAKQQPEKYNFIGECYVDGLMDGALVEELADHQRPGAEEYISLL